MNDKINTKVEEALVVLDAFRCAGYQQVCCGFPQGGGMNENGDGEPPECCGRPFDNEDLLQARTTLAAHIAQQDATIARLVSVIENEVFATAYDLERRQVAGWHTIKMIADAFRAALNPKSPEGDVDKSEQGK